MSETELLTCLRAARDRMDASQRRLWDMIRINPQRWRLNPYGDESGGFWVVGLLGTTVIWFNDVEEGFNRSCWSQFGQIDECWCNQDELAWTIQELLDIMTGQSHRTGFGSPEPIT